ncbi:MAG: hypothetical protein ABH816_03960 [Candidatus Levyibacteriota bacterium]
MKTERIVISFIAVAIGILFAGIVFYFYQTTKVVPASQTKTITVTSPSPTSSPSISLSVDNPKDEAVSDTKIISVSGKTTTDAVIAIITNSQNQVVTPASNGNFSANITLDDRQNEIEITAIAANGEETRIVRTVTYSTENF